MAKQNRILINCSCGCNEFKMVDKEFVCIKCNTKIEDEKVCFLQPTNKKLSINIAKFAIESAAIGGGVLIGMLIPFAEPFAFTALGAVSKKAGEWLGELFKGKMYDQGTYGEQLSKKFDSVYGKIYKTDRRNTNGVYQSFRNYSDYCRRHYMEVLSLLIEKELSADVFSEEAIKAVISEENHYPGADNPQILDNVLTVSWELEREYKQAILNDKELCFRWLIEKRTGTLEEKIDKIIEYLTHPVEKIKLTDAEFEYIRSYNRSLFLEDDSDISLNSVYVDPIVEDNGNNITDEIYNWYEYDNEKILIIKGAAGIGKTSLVSRIIADTYGHSDFKNDLKKENVFPIILRSNSDSFENVSSNKTPIAIIKDILDVRSEDIQNSLIILDGLDELALLSKGFDCRKFLDDLVGDLDNLETTKVLITSRPMNEIDKDIENVEVKSVVWEKEQILAWCEKFKNASEKDSEKQWCDEFIANYDDLAQNDSDGNKMDIFKAPMILYLACHSDSKISANETVGEFYDRVFRSIAGREHLKKHVAPNVLKSESEKENIINWQFTKELAYQLFLHDTLILSDSELIKNAENRTAEVLVNRGIIANKDDFEIDKLKYLAVTHFAKESSEEKGIEFAHKTVYEYFTAVKLYEDYFAEITADYPANIEIRNGLTPLENVWTNIIEAFRYKKIDTDIDETSIFTYLNKMKRPVYNGKAKDEGKGFDFNTFVKYFVEGMEQKILADLEIKSRVKEYAVNSDLLTTQIGCAFRNLTWFLTERKNGFFNEDDVDECKDFKEFISDKYSDLNLENWNLSGANFENVILSNAILVGTNLSNADLSKSNLEQIHFINVDLTESNLYNVNLSHSNMKRVQLLEANMELSNLDSCFIYECNIECAELGCSNLHNVTMIKTCLYGTTMQGANLTYSTVKECDFTETEFKEADLSGTAFINSNLDEADLRRAQYCLDVRYETKFPEGFNPKERGMIEVDIYGEPVKKSEKENIMEEN